MINQLISKKERRKEIKIERKSVVDHDHVIEKDAHDLKKGKKKEGIIFLYFEIYFLFSLIIL